METIGLSFLSYLAYAPVTNMRQQTRAAFQIRVEITSGMTSYNVGRYQRKVLKTCEALNQDRGNAIINFIIFLCVDYKCRSH